MRRIEDLAERAGFIDVTIEPSPLALARIAEPDVSFVRRLVAQGDAHRMVIRNRLPVAAIGTSAPGRSHPDVDLSSIDIAVAYFEDFMTDPALGEVIDRIDDRVAVHAESDQRDANAQAPLPIQLVDVPYPPFPAHDQRSAQRQAVALGAAVGAAGLAGPLRPVDMILSSVAVDDQFDRPWAFEELSMLPDTAPETSSSGMKRMARRFRSRKHR